MLLLHRNPLAGIWHASWHVNGILMGSMSRRISGPLPVACQMRLNVGVLPGPMHMIEKQDCLPPKQHGCQDAQLVCRSACSLSTCSLAACRDLMEGKYYPAISMFTLPHQKEGATMSVNFGACPHALSLASIQALLVHGGSCQLRAGQMAL